MKSRLLFERSRVLSNYNCLPKQKILDFLETQSSSVICIDGPIGIGKSFFIEEISDSFDEVIRIDPSVEQVSEWIQNSRFSSRVTKLVTIEHINRFNWVQQDSLLSILENPPENTSVIITSLPGFHNIQNSIRSRFDRTFSFLPWTEDQISEWAESISYKSDQARFCRGNPGVLRKINLHSYYLSSIGWVENPKSYILSNTKESLSGVKEWDDKMYFLEFMETNFPVFSSGFQRRFAESPNLSVELHFQDVVLQSLRSKESI